MYPLQIPGSVYKLSNDGLGIASLSTPAIDLAAMKATATICTGAIDRQAEVILPDGGNYDAYKRNPVILWEHGFDSQITTPIAKCETPDGQLALRASERQIDADSYFIASDKTSSQLFNLIAEGVLRAVSIHVIPRQKLVQAIEGRSVTVYPEWDMLEFSWGRLGVNQEAVRKILDLGKLDGCEILPSIAKTLLPWAAQPRSDSAKPATKPATRPKAMDPNELPADPPADDPVPADDSEIEAPAQKPSQALMGAIAQSLSELQANVAAGMKMIENPEAIEFLEGDFKTAFDSLTDMVSSFVPAKTLETDDGEGGQGGEPKEGPEPDEETVKTWLAGGAGRGSIFAGYAAQLESLAKSPRLAGPQKALVTRIGQTIRKAVADSKGVAKTLKDTSKAAKDADATAAEIKLAERIEGVAKNFGKLAGDLKTLVPAS